MAATARPGRLPELVADQIQAEILATRLEPGAQLPTESQLTERHDVSRTVIREAARILEQRGLVDIRPGRGMTVTRPSTTPIARHYALLLKATPDAFDQLMDLRVLVETCIAGLAAQHRTDHDLAMLQASIDAAERHRDDYEAGLRDDLNFHLLLGGASGNAIMSLLVEPINECLRESYRVPSAYVVKLQVSIAEHQAILDAIRDRDAEAAREATRQHLERIRQHPEDLFDRPDGAAR
ncbi:FadR/GntR family transcriptional regulator [Phytohabitans kaempferiae]|uniref:FadR/GntR family transcriptional regulator n=1 Tax=Phytohabitans kaempferiae TaxID=1620943 RepID=A0ABV6MBQ3_9ACTN